MTPLKTPTVHFIPLTPEETRQHYPRYHREDITCFLIAKDTSQLVEKEQQDSAIMMTSIGLYGLIDRGVDPLTGESLGEGFLTIFPEFQFRVLNQRFFTALFDHALTCGFAKVYTWTRFKSWQTLFQRFESLGIQRLDSPPYWDEESEEGNNAATMKGGPKVWFMKRKDV